ncbi:autophagy-related protein 18f-like [Curcuma longa]|uniref:autophagy-related protein 18f-like n=1 Tax=Curcuma longa TaxID=136217 RepID=UPI003D9F14F1
MRNDVHGHRDDGVPRNHGGNGLFSVRSLSNYMRIVSSGASNVASSVRSAGASIVSSVSDRHDDSSRDEVQWAGFDKLEFDDFFRQVLLLGFRSGFQVWDVHQSNNVRQIASRHDGPVSFLQMQKKLKPAMKQEDKFAEVRPLLIVAEEASISMKGNNLDGDGSSFNESTTNWDMGSDTLSPAYLRFYSLRTHDYVHVLKFRAAIISVRCSSQVIVVCQATQIQCFNAATLVRGYTILTYPIGAACPGSSGIGYGPLTIGTRWLAYSGKLIATSNTGRVSPKNMSPAKSVSLPHSNSGLVANFAKESSKQLAAGLVTLGDMGYKKISKYYSELLAEHSGPRRHGTSSLKHNGTTNGQLSDTENVGMVIVRDIVSKSIIVQFKAHSSPISALCFDPSGMLLVTASIHGHNINIFGITISMLDSSAGSNAKGSYIHLYRLQRGITNAVIQDINFSDDSKWIMISSSRGTSHLFELSSSDAATELQSREVKFANNLYESDFMKNALGKSLHVSSSPKHIHMNLLSSGPPVTLSAVSRIRNGNPGLKGAVSGAAAAATGKVNPSYGAIASAFHNCNGSRLHTENSSLMSAYYLLVLSPAGSIIQYVLRERNGDNYVNVSTLSNSSYWSIHEGNSRLHVEALQKWDVCHKRNRRDRGDNVDIYGDHFQMGGKKGTNILSAGTSTDMKIKHNGEENQHMYLSEVELHVHEARTPLWAKSEICFRVMMDENVKSYDSGSYYGEVDIENITSHTIEARSKDLVPVFNNSRTPMSQQLRINVSVTNQSELLYQQKSRQLESGRLSHISHSFLDYDYDNHSMAEFPSGISDNCWKRSMANEGFVNNNTHDQFTRNEHRFVDSSENLKLETQLELVENTKEIEDLLSL